MMPANHMPSHAGGLAYMALGSPSNRVIGRQQPLSRVSLWMAFVITLLLALPAVIAVAFA